MAPGVIFWSIPPAKILATLNSYKWRSGFHIFQDSSEASIVSIFGVMSRLELISTSLKIESHCGQKEEMRDRRSVIQKKDMVMKEDGLGEIMKRDEGVKRGPVVRRYTCRASIWETDSVMT